MHFRQKRSKIYTYQESIPILIHSIEINTENQNYKSASLCWIGKRNEIMCEASGESGANNKGKLGTGHCLEL